MDREALITLTADIVAAHVSNNHVAVGDIATLVERVHGALSGLETSEQAPQEEKRAPAVPVRSSVRPESITCLYCGRKQKTLKRHIRVAHGVTPAEYRQEFGLKTDYPMVAPAYAETRRTLAHSIGLGRKKAEPAAARRLRKGSGNGAKSAEVTPKPAPRRRKAAARNGD